MSRQLVGWQGDWSGLRVGVLGLGKTGFSVADTLLELGAEVLVYAKHAEPEHLNLLEVIGGRLVTGSPQEALDEFENFNPEIVVTSPGFNPRHELIVWAASKNLEVWTDIDLAWRLRDVHHPNQKWIFITGTNGKTTVTELTTALLLGAGLSAVSCGNIGTPILDALRDPVGYEWLVVEISSFQLHYSEGCVPYASALLNIAEDHLDWHGSYVHYQEAKAKVFNNTKVAAIYNVADPLIVGMLEAAEVSPGCRAIGFTLGIPARSDVGYVEDLLVDRAFHEDRANSAREVIELSELQGMANPAPHLMSNIAAATALALSAGVNPEQARQTLSSYTTAPHRIQHVAQIDGVDWVNDSKATNAHAANAALRTSSSVIWILGGLLKGVNIDELVEKHRERLRALVVIGLGHAELAQRLRALLPGVPVHSVEPGAEVMGRAVKAAAGLAKSGDTVLLAPAAASMDQFKDYADRGEQFMAAVRGLQQ